MGGHWVDVSLCAINYIESARELYKGRDVRQSTESTPRNQYNVKCKSKKQQGRKEKRRKKEIDQERMDGGGL